MSADSSHRDAETHDHCETKSCEANKCGDRLLPWSQYNQYRNMPSWPRRYLLDKLSKLFPGSDPARRSPTQSGSVRQKSLRRSKSLPHDTTPISCDASRLDPNLDCSSATLGLLRWKSPRQVGGSGVGGERTWACPYSRRCRAGVTDNTWSEEDAQSNLARRAVNSLRVPLNHNNTAENAIEKTYIWRFHV